jgi:hypothetical protein
LTCAIDSSTSQETYATRLSPEIYQSQIKSKHEKGQEEILIIPALLHFDRCNANC